MKKLYLSIILLVTAMLVVTGCSSSSSSSAKSNVVQDELLMFIQDGEEDNLGSLYILGEDEARVKIASDVQDGQFWMLPDSAMVLYLDEDNALHLYVDQDTTHDVATGVDGDSLMYSGDESTIAYLREDANDLYTQVISEDEVQERQKLASDVDYFNYYMSYDGSSTYYVDGDDILFVKKGEEPSVEIARDVSYYRVSDSDEYVLYESSRGDFYVYTFETEENRRIDVEDVSNMQITDDESLLLLLTDYNYETGRGELFAMTLSDHELTWIASDVSNYALDPAGDHVYYLNDSKQFMVKSLKDEENTTIASDVESFQMAPNAKDVIYTDDLDNLYLKSMGDDESVKLSNEIQNATITDETVYVLNTEHTLSYTDDENSLVTIEKNVKNMLFSPNKTVLAYLTEDDQIFFQQGTKDATEKMTTSEDYSKIYFYNYKLYENLLNVKDFVGYWEFENGVLFDINSDDELTRHVFEEYDKYTDTTELRVVGESQNTGSMYLWDLSEVYDVELSENDEFYLEEYMGATPVTATRISREEFDQKLADLEEEMNQRVEQYEEEQRLAQQAAERQQAADDLAYYYLYEDVIIPAGLTKYESPSMTSTVIGTTTEAEELYVFDTEVDENYNVWLEISDTYDLEWVKAEEGWQLVSGY